MDTTTLEPAGAPAEATPRLLDRCPRCGAGMLYQVGAPALGRFLCRHCLRCWETGPAGTAQVPTATCPGCEWRWACEARLSG